MSSEQGFFASIGLPRLAYHWHVLVLSTLTCNFTVAFSRFISPVLCPKTYNTLKGHKRLSWDVHAVSMVHCILVVILSFHLLFDENLKRDKVFGYDTYAGNVYAIACGYFLWDAMASLYQARENGYGFVLHGLCCFGVYLFAFRPFLNYYGAVFLMFELSTPFLNIHWFMDKLGYTGSIFQLINGVVLIFVFLSVRLVFGLYMSYQTFLSVKAVISQVPIYIRVIYSVANITLHILNLYWFTRMISAMKRRFTKKVVNEEKELQHSKGKGRKVFPLTENSSIEDGNDLKSNQSVDNRK
ncbi:hypothetical protein G9A89_015693 [Geosiphon pyriformis]|nr:hypothetical protein G9A89_015693 [Geosiphon pyriformis]